MLRKLIALNNRRFLSSVGLEKTQLPILILTDNAVRRLKQVAKEGEMLRVTVEGGGCAGFEYKLSLDNNLTDEDVVVEKEGSKVVVDQFVKGSTIDFSQDLMRAAFRITHNPLATSGCSCGSSFAPKSLS